MYHSKQLPGHPPLLRAHLHHRDRAFQSFNCDHGRHLRQGQRARESGVAIWNKIGFVVDFRNLLFGRDFDLSFSKGYSLMKIFNYEADFTAKCDT